MGWKERMYADGIDGAGGIETMETKDLILREWRESDAADLYEMCLDTALRKSGVCCFDSVEESLETIMNWRKDKGFRAIVSKEDHCLAGFISLGDMNRYEGYMELEYAVAARYRNRGYATQAVKCMTDYGFRELGALAIAAWVRSHNEGSVHVLEKCSFAFEGRLRRHARDKSDTLCYSILKEEWETERG